MVVYVLWRAFAGVFIADVIGIILCGHMDGARILCDKSHRIVFDYSIHAVDDVRILFERIYHFDELNL